VEKEGGPVAHPDPGMAEDYLHFTASEISADDITAPISPHRTSPLAKLTAFALHR